MSAAQFVYTVFLFVGAVAARRVWCWIKAKNFQEYTTLILGSYVAAAKFVATFFAKTPDEKISFVIIGGCFLFMGLFSVCDKFKGEKKEVR